MIDHCSYSGQPDCRRISNGTAEVIVATAIGPRIIRYALEGGENILAELPDVTVPTPIGTWKPWGGHRLWAAPEVMPRSYAPDNDPVEFNLIGEHSIQLKGQTEPATGIGKEMTVTLDPAGSGVMVHHRITNHGPWGIDLAPWGLTIMNGGGVTIIPQEPFRPHGEELLPARPMILWHYTDLTDPRWTFGRRYILLRTDEALPHPQKIGVANRRGWAAYHRNGILFIKRFEYSPGAEYPDFGSNNETYTAGTFMELESLAPMAHLEPGESAEHTERWELHPNVDIGTTEETITLALAPFVGGDNA
jgi:hypothetical protein